MEASDALATIWVKRMNVAEGQYSATKGVDLQQTVDDLKASWLSLARLDIHHSFIKLLLVSCAGDEPTADEELTAKELRPHHTLAKACVADGSWLLASVAGTAANLPLEPPSLTGRQLDCVLAAFSTLRVDSPSKNSVFKLLSQQAAFLCFQGRPFSVKSLLVDDSFACIAALATAGGECLLAEASLYPLATFALPAWVNAKTRSGAEAVQTAAALYGPPESVAVPPNLSLPWFCQPELFTEAPVGRPGYVGELKSAGKSDEMFNEILTYSIFAMLKALFPASRCIRFYARPPACFCLLAFPHVGYLGVVEMLGKPFFFPMCEPFVLGSPRHGSAVAALPELDYSDFFELDKAASGQWGEYTPERGSKKRGPAVTWSLSPVGTENLFVKIISFDAFDSHVRGSQACLRGLAETYRSFSDALLDDADPPPPSLLRSRILFGAFAMCVTMPFVGGREATHGELCSSGPVVDACATAIAWLGRHSLLYIDMREFNVRVSDDGGTAWLIDYDDMELAASPPESGAALVQLLKEKSIFFIDSCSVALAEAVCGAWR